MRDPVTLNGMVLLAAPAGDYDRRLVLLTTDRGRITAFANGARRPGSPLMGATRTFVFGSFTLREGRSAYSLVSVAPVCYFEELAADVEGACMGSYLTELADYYSRENMEATELLTLLYQSLKALSKPAIPNALIRRIFELRLMVINGEYTEEPPGEVSASCRYAWQYVTSQPVAQLYQFALTPEVLREFEDAVEMARHRFLPHECRALEIMKMMTH